MDFMTRSRLQMDFSKIQDELGMTMVLITHDVNEAVLLSDKTVFLEEGKSQTRGEYCLTKAAPLWRPEFTSIPANFI